jgi:hypothetical protein
VFGYEMEEPEPFTVEIALNLTPPLTPELISPDNSSATGPTQRFEWSGVSDPSGVRHDSQYSSDPTFPENWLPGWRWRRPVRLTYETPPVTEGLVS